LFFFIAGPHVMQAHQRDNVMANPSVRPSIGGIAQCTHRHTFDGLV